MKIKKIIFLLKHMVIIDMFHVKHLKLLYDHFDVCLIFYNLKVDIRVLK